MEQQTAVQYVHTQWCRLLFDNLTNVYLHKNPLVFYGIRRKIPS
jgi:hypothetical protein